MNILGTLLLQHSNESELDTSHYQFSTQDMPVGCFPQTSLHANGKKAAWHLAPIICFTSQICHDAQPSSANHFASFKSTERTLGGRGATRFSINTEACAAAICGMPCWAEIRVCSSFLI